MDGSDIQSSGSGSACRTGAGLRAVGAGGLGLVGVAADRTIAAGALARGAALGDVTVNDSPQAVHFTRRPASSGFNLYCLLQFGHAIVWLIFPLLVRQ
jgi:hypothetical protein